MQITLTSRQGHTLKLCAEQVVQARYYESVDTADLDALARLKLVRQVMVGSWIATERGRLLVLLFEAERNRRIEALKQHGWRVVSDRGLFYLYPPDVADDALDVVVASSKALLWDEPLYQHFGDFVLTMPDDPVVTDTQVWRVEGCQVVSTRSTGERYELVNTRQAKQLAVTLNQSEADRVALRRLRESIRTGQVTSDDGPVQPVQQDGM